MLPPKRESSVLLQLKLGSNHRLPPLSPLPLPLSSPPSPLPPLPHTIPLLPSYLLISFPYLSPPAFLPKSLLDALNSIPP